MFEFIKKLIYKNYQPPIKVEDRLALLKKGDIITIEMDRIKGGIGNVTVVSNDPKTQKLLIAIKWSNYKEIKDCEPVEQFILPYYVNSFKNFNLLNPPVNELTLKELIFARDEAIAKEQYEKAQDLQNKIDKYGA